MDGVEHGAAVIPRPPNIQAVVVAGYAHTRGAKSVDVGEEVVGVDVWHQGEESDGEAHEADDSRSQCILFPQEAVEDLGNWKYIIGLTLGGLISDTYRVQIPSWLQKM